MRESKEEYTALVKKEVITLEWILNRQIKHLSLGFCPSCGSYGNFDIEGLGFSTSTTNSIYYSTVFNRWTCRSCDFWGCC